MAKESMKAREVKRAKLVARYAEKRAALKQIVRTGDPAEAFEAAQKLQDLPKNSNPIRMHNRCKLTGLMISPWLLASKYLMGRPCILSNIRQRSFLSVPWVMMAMSWLKARPAMSETP